MSHESLDALRDAGWFQRGQSDAAMPLSEFDFSTFGPDVIQVVMQARAEIEKENERLIAVHRNLSSRSSLSPEELEELERMYEGLVASTVASVVSSMIAVAQGEILNPIGLTSDELELWRGRAADWMKQIDELIARDPTLQAVFLAMQARWQEDPSAFVREYALGLRNSIELQEAEARKLAQVEAARQQAGDGRAKEAPTREEQKRDRAEASDSVEEIRRAVEEERRAEEEAKREEDERLRAQFADEKERMLREREAAQREENERMTAHFLLQAEAARARAARSQASAKP